MLFSAKITNSIWAYVRNHAVGGGPEDCGVEAIAEAVDLPVEFLQDPTCWLEAKKVEQFLAAFVTQCEKRLGPSDIIENVGHQAKELKTWGALDSVLRMIERPQDIFLQPQRFISYFVSPAPPIANIRREEASIEFDLPISYEEFPYVVTYLRAAMEAIPTYVGESMAETTWENNHIRIRWAQMQTPLLGEDFERRHMAPEVMENLIATLERTEQALIEKTRELEQIRQENAMAAQSQLVARLDWTPTEQILSHVQNQLFKLQDYFARSQQLITLLVGQGRQSAQVREAMKRVNWEQVQESYPRVAQEILDSVDPSVILAKDNATDKQSSAMIVGDKHVHREQSTSP